MIRIDVNLSPTKCHQKVLFVKTSVILALFLATSVIFSHVKSIMARNNWTKFQHCSFDRTWPLLLWTFVLNFNCVFLSFSCSSCVYSKLPNVSCGADRVKSNTPLESCWNAGFKGTNKFTFEFLREKPRFAMVGFASYFCICLTALILPTFFSMCC